MNNSGLIQARTIDDLKGNIKLYADGGTVNVSGTLDASAPNGGDGGLIETSGNKVSIADSAIVTTKSAYGTNGTWLLDPDGFTIGLTSADGDMTATALNTALTSGNVTIASTSGSGTDGNINVNGAVTWSANTLTLNATNNVYVNAVMTATGTASFAANYGYLLSNGVPTTTPSGTGNADGTPYGLYCYQGAALGSFVGSVNFSGIGTVMLNGQNYTLINAATTTATNGVMAYGLDYIANNLAGNYVLGSNITGSWTGPISASDFTGNFNGFGHTISSPILTATGVFGTIGSGGTVSNIGVVSATVTAAASGASTVPAVGTLANYNQGDIINSFASGTLNNSNITRAGGLVGANSGLIAQSYYAGQVFAVNIAGGLVGTNASGGTVLDELGAGFGSRLLRLEYLRGHRHHLCGRPGRRKPIWRNDQPVLCRKPDKDERHDFHGRCFCRGEQRLHRPVLRIQVQHARFPHRPQSRRVRLEQHLNRHDHQLIYHGPLQHSTSANWTAGFAYENEGTITNAYATSYSAGTLNSARYGFVYSNTGTITDAYWYAYTSSGSTPVTDTSGATNLTATQAATFSSYTGFGTSDWAASKSGYPILDNLFVYVSNSSTPTYGSATSTISTLGLTARGLQGGGGAGGGGGTTSLLDSITSTTYNPFTVTTDNGYVDAGVWKATAILSSSTPYENIKGVVMVNRKALTLASGTVQNKTYDGTTSAAFNGTPTLSGFVNGQTLNVTYTSAAFASPNAGTGQTVNLTYTAANGTNGGQLNNYTIPSTTTATITPKSITATISANNKTYDGTTTDTATYTLPGVISGDNLSLAYSAAFTDPNAAANKTVNITGISLSGTSAGNYSLTNTSTLQTTATISPLALILYGALSSNPGSTTIPASTLSATNVVVGDTVAIGGSATIAGTSSGAQPITNVSSLTVSNPNYTLTGATGAVVIGSQSLALDHVASGTANISTSGTTTTITTSTNSTVIDWWRFMIAANETVNFVEPSATSIVLNRVTGSEQSVINGILTANGRVFLINSNGILFGSGSSVNVGAFLASSLSISDTNFNGGNYVFAPASTSAPVINNGGITTSDGGFIALSSNQGVTNSGTLNAPDGKAILVSADSLTLSPNTATNGLTSYAIASLDGTTILNGVVNVAGSLSNGGLIETAGSVISLGNGYQIGTGNSGHLVLQPAHYHHRQQRECGRLIHRK